MNKGRDKLKKLLSEEPVGTYDISEKTVGKIGQMLRRGEIIDFDIIAVKGRTLCNRVWRWIDKHHPPNKESARRSRKK